MGEGAWLSFISTGGIRNVTQSGIVITEFNGVRLSFETSALIRTLPGETIVLHIVRPVSSLKTR